MINENRTALDTIQHLNLSQGLPPQPADATLFNQGFFETPKLLEPIRLPPYHFNHPLSNYCTPEIIAFIREYGVAIWKLNSPKTYSIGALDIPTTRNQFVTLATREVNLAGFWCLVQRSIFLCGTEPLVTIDFVAPSTVSAADNTPAPAEIWFRRPADLGHP
jgi:hypothetical protein